ncbi:hypothetical protein CBL_04859 [Carabus blaptoides fortunei]
MQHRLQIPFATDTAVDMISQTTLDHEAIIICLPKKPIHKQTTCTLMAQEATTNSEQASSQKTQNRNSVYQIPSHKGIKGKEKANEASKCARTLETTSNTPVPTGDLKSIIKSKIKEEWQNE